MLIKSYHRVHRYIFFFSKEQLSSKLFEMRLEVSSKFGNFTISMWYLIWFQFLAAFSQRRLKQKCMYVCFWFFAPRPVIPKRKTWQNTHPVIQRCSQVATSSFRFLCYSCTVHFVFVLVMKHIFLILYHYYWPYTLRMIARVYHLYHAYRPAKQIAVPKMHYSSKM